MKISQFYIQQLGARLEAYEKLSHEWKERGYDVSGKVTIILENQRRYLDSLDGVVSKHALSNKPRAEIYDDIIQAFNSEDPRWEPVASMVDALYTPEGKRRMVHFQMFQVFPSGGLPYYETASPNRIVPPLPTDPYQNFVKNLFRNCEGRLLGVYTPMVAALDYPELYRGEVVAIVAGVWVYDRAVL